MSDHATHKVNCRINHEIKLNLKKANTWEKLKVNRMQHNGKIFKSCHFTGITLITTAVTNFRFVLSSVDENLLILFCSLFVSCIFFNKVAWFICYTAK